MNTIYDIIVIGGGIAGLNICYEVSEKSPSTRFLLLESSNRLGGRISTYYHKISKNERIVLEEGAGRFSQKHRLLKKIIHDLDLDSFIHKISSDTLYLPIRSDNRIDDQSELLNKIDKVVKYSMSDTRENMIPYSFLEYAKNVLSDVDIEYIKNSFGYYSELVLMNAYDAIQLILELHGSGNFYSLGCGLTQVIERMVAKIKQKHSRFYLLNHACIDIQKKTEELYSVQCSNGKQFSCHKIVCALPKQAIEQIAFFKPLRPLLSKIICAPLCRIYCRFLVEPGKKVWFSDIRKFTTNNMLRMVIPINPEQGTILISYTDNRFAKFWKKLLDTKGKEAVNAKLREYMKQSTGFEIPEPLETHVFYWNCGVGYWGIGADSSKISREIRSPYFAKNIYICGEHFSEKKQQWIEGALETSHTVVSKLLSLK
jgi:monoamine oxidase